MRRLLALLRARTSPPARPTDADRLLRIYRQTVAEVQQLRRAA